MSLESTSATTMCGRENVKNNNKAAQAKLSIFIYVCYIPYGIITTKSKTVYSNEMVSHILEPKWGYNPFAQTFQQNAPVLKLFKKMYCPCLKLDFLKLEFQWRTQFAQNRVIG